MKVKLSIDNLVKFKIACEATDVKVMEHRNFGKKTVVIVNVKSASQLYELGQVESTITEVEITESEALKMQSEAMKEIATSTSLVTTSKEPVKPEPVKAQENVKHEKK